jgi:hypothetical protein
MKVKCFLIRYFSYTRNVGNNLKMKMRILIILTAILFIHSCNNASSKTKAVEQVEYFWTSIKITAETFNEINAYLEDIIPNPNIELTETYKIELQNIRELTSNIDNKTSDQLIRLKDKKKEYTDTRLIDCAVNYLSITKELNSRIDQLLKERQNGQLYDDEEEIWSEINELAYQVSDWEIRCKDLLETFYREYNISDEEVDLIKRKINSTE